MSWRKESARESASTGAVGQHYELELVPGLEELVRQELHERFARRVSVLGQPRPDRMAVRFGGRPDALSALRSVVAVHVVLWFDVSRPKALLGHEHFTRLQSAIRELVLLPSPGAFRSFRLSAAGSESAVLARLQVELAGALGLERAGGQGDLLLALRRPPDDSPGWQVLLRTTPRPLSARPWRVCNLPGALNATVAYALARLGGCAPGKVVVNLACGSGTLLVECLDQGPVRAAIGVDTSESALACAEANLRAGGHAGKALLLRGDVANLPLRARSADVMLADLPFGMLVGSAVENERLYPELLVEAARVATRGARLVAITANARPFERAEDLLDGIWRRLRSVRVSLPYRSGQIKPTIYILERV